MDVFLVGGAVRDGLLGLSGADRDWVVVGATPQALVDAGYLPVGKDFPVFLHPQTREEYALARTERKSGRGYRGFVVQASPDVTLEQDLARRDLTINAIAQPAQVIASAISAPPSHPPTVRFAASQWPPSTTMTLWAGRPNPMMATCCG